MKGLAKMIIKKMFNYSQIIQILEIDHCIIYLYIII